MTVSLVLVSPSTVIWFQLLTLPRRNMARHRSGVTGASQVITDSMVALQQGGGVLVYVGMLEDVAG